MKMMKGKETGDWPTLIACGILKREIQQIIAKNGWPVKTRFLDSSMHINFGRLSRALTGALSADETRKLVLYGTCHPRMDEMVADAGAVRTPVQNCVELLLGRERFSRELSQGAFFLFEDWARRWDDISYRYFGDWEVMREVFQDAHTHVLCVRTPCSGNFEIQADLVARRTGLPLEWEDAGLAHLESVLTENLLKMVGEPVNG